jgi:hypothetical protein
VGGDDAFNDLSDTACKQIDDAYVFSGTNNELQLANIIFHLDWLSIMLICSRRQKLFRMFPLNQHLLVVLHIEDTVLELNNQEPGRYQTHGRDALKGDDLPDRLP